MNLYRTLKTARKVGTFLASVHPPLGRAWSRFRARRDRWLAGATVQRLRASPRGVAVEKLIDRFFWKDYDRDRVDWSTLHPESRALRPALAAALALCVLLPVAVILPWPAVTVPESARGPVAAWSIALWPGALALAWGTLLAGAAAANRPALAVSVAFYFVASFDVIAEAGARSVLHVFAAVTTLLAAAFAERRQRERHPPGIAETAAGLATSLAVGVASGLLLVMLTPLGHGMHQRQFPLGVALGIPLGAAAWSAGRVLRPLPSLPLATSVLTGCTLAFLSAATLRHGLAATAAAMRSLLELLVSSLWPAWYFVGVGVVFAVLKSSRVVSDVVRELVPARVMVPLVTVALSVAALALWSPRVLETPAVHWPAPVVFLAAVLHRATRGLVWHYPVRAVAAGWYRWVLLGDLAALGLLGLRRRLDAAAAATLFYQALFAWLFIYEYVFEQYGFVRSGGHSAAALFAFSVWLLWMLRGIGLRLGSEDSPRWPAPARLAVFGSLQLLVMLDLHARAASHDPRLMNDTFLYLFRGVVDVGLPYALYVWASRRLPTVPVPTHRVLAAFCTGALFNLPLAALDKLVLAGGSLARLGATLDARAADLTAGLATGFDNRLPLPPGWIAARGALSVGALGVLAALAARRARGQREAPAVVLFTVTAAGAGLASFAKALLNLPLPSLQGLLLITPQRISLDIDAHAVATYLCHGLPALALGTAVSRPGALASPWRWLAGLTSAYVLHLAVALSWPAHEPWLRSTGVLWTLGLAGIALLAGLTVLARGYVDATLPASIPPAAPEVSPAPRRPPWLPAAGVLAAMALTTGVTAWQAHVGRTIIRAVPGTPHRLGIPAPWQPPPSPTTRATLGPHGAYLHTSLSEIRPLLLVSAVRAPGAAPGKLLAQQFAMAARMLSGMAASRPVPGGMTLPGAAMMDFAYDFPRRNGRSVRMSGTMAAVPAADGRTLLMSLAAMPDEWADLRWDLARIAASAGRPPSPPPVDPPGGR